MNLDIAIKKKVSHLLNHSPHGIYSESDCKQICRELKDEGYSVLVKDFPTITKEVKRQNSIKSGRWHMQYTPKENKIKDRRDNYILAFSKDLFIKHYGFSDREVYLFFGSPKFKCNKTTQWKGNQYLEIEYEFTINIDNHWKSKLYNKKIHIVDDYFVTHIFGEEKIGDYLVRHVSCIGRRFKYVVTHYENAIILEKDNQRIMLANIDDCIKNSKFISSNFDKKYNSKFFKGQKKSMEVMKALNPESNFNVKEFIYSLL